MMQLNGIVVNDGFFADGSFIEDNYYTLEEIKHKVYSPLITEDLEETEKFVKEALEDHKARRAVRIKAEYFAGLRNSEHWAYYTDCYQLRARLDTTQYSSFPDSLYQQVKADLKQRMGHYFSVPSFAPSEEYNSRGCHDPSRKAKVTELRFAALAQEGYIKFLYDGGQHLEAKRNIKKTFKAMYYRAWSIEHQKPLIFNQIAINLGLFSKLRYLHLQICETVPIETSIPLSICMNGLVGRTFFVPYQYHQQRYGAPLSSIGGPEYYEGVANRFKLLLEDEDPDSYKSFSREIAYSQELDCLKS